MGWFHVKPTGIIQEGVIAFGHGSHDGLFANSGIRVLLQNRLNDPCGHGPYCHCVRQSDGRLEHAELPYLHGTGQLPAPVHCVPRRLRPPAPDVPTVRHNDRHPGPHGSLAGDERSLASGKAHVTDPDLPHVGNRVLRTWVKSA